MKKVSDPKDGRDVFKLLLSLKEKKDNNEYMLVTVFNTVAEKLLQETAQKFACIESQDFDAEYLKISSRVKPGAFLFGIRKKLETFNGKEVFRNYLIDFKRV